MEGKQIKGTVVPSVVKSELLTQDEVIRRRLVADGDGSGDDRRIQTFLKSFLTLCSSEEFNPAEDDLTFRRLMQQIQQLEYSAKRTHAAILMSEDSKHVYADLQAGILEESDRTRRTIQDAKKIIEEETKHRKHSLEYEALCKLIESKPDRKATEERRKELEQTVKKYTELRKDLIQAVENREKQVKSLAFVIEALKDDIEAEDSKLWGNSPLNDIVPMEVDSFPLEKDDFPLLPQEPPPAIVTPTVTASTTLTTVTASTTLTSPDDAATTEEPSSSAAELPNSSAPVAMTASPAPPEPTKDKYEELSEESPEEGESED